MNLIKSNIVLLVKKLKLKKLLETLVPPKLNHPYALTFVNDLKYKNRV